MNNPREDLKAIYSEAISSVNPEQAVRDHVKVKGGKLSLFSENAPLKEFDLSKYKNIFVVGSGKATAPMARAMEDIISGKISRGLITVKYGYVQELSDIEIIEASHPVPDASGVKGAKMILDIIMDAGKDDLVISLISGGGSALLPLPPEAISLNEKRQTTELLLKSGATIHEINSIRKHLSLVKGGNLAKAAYPATVINLMISDVVGDDMDVIASGPFVPDESTFSSAMEIFVKYNLLETIPKTVLSYIESGINGEIEENPKENSPVFKNVNNLIIASNIISLQAAKREAERRGYNCIILSSMIEGDTKDVSYYHSMIAKEILASSNPVAIPACVISGGETTVEVKGSGLGGRNMEFAMHAALYIKGYDNILMASIGTDGTDGPTDAAGALADGNTIYRAESKDIDIMQYINNNDSYNFFTKTGDLIKTGPTNTNVMDIRIVIVSPIA